MIYMVVWSGGYEAPSYVLKDTRDEAFEQAAEWAKDMTENDTIDVLELDTKNKTVARLEA